MAERTGYSDALVNRLLAQLRETGDPRVRDQVIEHMAPLVTSVARKFAGREPIEDLESEGYVGLIRAVDRYTADRGTRFSTFATHLIAGQIRHYLRDRGHLIRQPAWLQELSSRVARVTAELEQRLQREPTIEEIAAASNVSEEGVEELLAARRAARVVRMDAGSGNDDEDHLEVDPEKFRSRDYVTLQLPIEDRIVLEAALEKLKDLEKKVLRSFYFQEFNQSEIARQLGISCNYTGYVLRNGLKHMRERLPQDRIPTRVPQVGTDPSILDSLTGLYAREYFERRLQEEVSRAGCFGQSVSVCCLSLPEPCSDAALRGAAEVLRGATRRADILGRTGDRELSVIFPNTGSVGAQVALRLGELLYPVLKAPVHAAAATYPDDGRGAAELFEAARTMATSGRPTPPTVKLASATPSLAQ